MFAPKARVTVTTNGTNRKAMVLHHINCGDGSRSEATKVNDVSAYHVRYGDGTKAVVKASQIHPKVKGQSA